MLHALLGDLDDQLLALLQIPNTNMVEMVHQPLLIALLIQHQVVEVVLQMLHEMMPDLVVLVVVEVMEILEEQDLEILDILVEQT